MRVIILALLGVLIFALVQERLVWAAMLAAIIFAAELLGAVVSRFFGFAGAVAEVTVETVKDESKLVEGAKIKYISGRKFAGEGLSRIGREVGKGEKAKEQGKRVSDNFTLKTAVGAVENLMEGLGKAFRK